LKGLLFTYGLCFGGAVASLFDPFVGLLIYVCFAIIKPEAMWYWSVPEGNYSRIVAIALLIGWAKERFGNWQFGRGKVVVLSLVGFVLWSCICATLAGHPEKSWLYVENIVKIALPILVGVTTIDSMRKLKLLVWVIVLSQGYIAYELNLNYLAGFNRMAEEGYGSLDNNGEALAMDACIGMACFLGMNEERWWKKIIAFGLMGCMIHAVLISFSRGGMLGLVITAVIAFFLIRKKPLHYAMFAAIVIGSLSLAGKETRARFTTIFAREEKRDSSAESRLELSAACLRATQQHPFTGLGPDNWPLAAQEYGFPAMKQAHTTWLRISAEMGVLGLLFYAMFHGCCCFRLWRMIRHPAALPDPWLGHLAQAVIASFVGFAVSAQFVSAELVEVPYYVILVGACVLKLRDSPPLVAGTAIAEGGEIGLYSQMLPAEHTDGTESVMQAQLGV
jgi:probable O-glycosylation ligase (exosortase A-associated)